MQTQTALEPQPQPAPDSPLLVAAEKLLDRMQELSQNVARRAYEFFETRGGAFGNELADWFRAEAELLLPVPMEINETDKQIAVRAEVPGFKAGEIKVSVEPQRLIISGESETKAAEQTGQAVYHEQRARQFCRAIELPAEVDPQRATATLKDGVLELTFDKIARAPAANIEVKAT